MTLSDIGDTILDETSSALRLRDALDEFSRLCSDIGGVAPDASFDAWAEDSFLDSGLAINPQAAAHCVTDYRRSVVFIRGVNGVIHAARSRFPGVPIRILYAGCGPFATLLLPLLDKFEAGELELHLLDIHQRSLASVRRLIQYFGLTAQRIHLVQGDACRYQHAGELHLIIAETMQKSLEQEPQFAVTANLAPQLCPGGIFVPENIEVELCLANPEREMEMFKHMGRLDRQALVKQGQRHPLATVLTLVPEQAAAQLRNAVHNENSSKRELRPIRFEIPSVENLGSFEPVMFTRIQVFAQHQLLDYEAEITLPQRCYELSSLVGGATFESSYQLGNYPRLNVVRR